jgi:type IV pilus assembly protein PilY1
VRGLDYSIYRSRGFGGTVWKLGDVIYSTPMPVSTPPEAYHMIYGDSSYYSFWNHYLVRRNVVYVGANDGMIHAFNSGITEELSNPFTPLRLNPAGYNLGEELWGHVPFNVLPHLKWLMDTSYCHVNYNDLRIYPTDVQIFTPDGDHINGWGTILISGMRFGGGNITVAGNTYSSAYTCYDVTNPEAGNYPRFMWEFKNDSLGYTLCLPVMVKITRSGGTRWFMLTGSGPQNMYGESARRACIFVIDPTNGTVAHKIILPAADSNSAITNIFATDWGLNYSVDLVYFGTYDKNGGGKIYRINTHEDTDPTTWTLHQVIDLNRPITAEGSVATDNRGNIWIYFGTGKYFSNVDVGDNTTQLYVGIKDDTTLGTATTPAFTLANLLDVTNVHIFADSVTGMFGVNDFDDLLSAVEAQKGWRRNLNTIVGERVVTPTLVFAGAVLFTTFAPNDTSGTASGPDLCIGGGGGPQAGNLWALFYLTGTAYKDAMLDTMPNGERSSHVSIVGDMPSEPSWFLDKVFVQSAGGYKPYEFTPPYDPFGGVILWRGR